MIEAAALLSALVRHWSDFAIIVVLLVMNAVVGFWEEYQAGNAIAALKEKLALMAKVLRDTEWSMVAARDLVPGDIIRVCIGVLDLILSILVGDFVFQVPLRGSLWLLAPLALLFLFGALSVGMLISIIAKNQLLASQLAIIATVLPAFLLSGFVFPIENMPMPIQAVTHLLTARYFVFILRGIYLKDVGMAVLWPEVLFLGVFGAIVMIVAVRKFKKRIA
jgi:hypothetical protein